METTNKEKKMFYALFDKDTKNYMATGCNCTSKEDVKEELLSLIAPNYTKNSLKRLEKLSPDELAETQNFVLEESEEKFYDEDGFEFE